MKYLAPIISHLFHPRRSNNHRPKILKPAAYFYLSGLMVLFVVGLQFLSNFGSNYGAILGFASTITPSQVVEHTNAQRQRAGLQPLVINQQLSQAAQAKGQNMMADQYWAHVSPDGTEPWHFIKESGYQYRVAGENLARDFAETSTMVSAWMASPTHRANIMNPRYSEIGIAVIDGVLEGYETTLVVQMFGQPAQIATDGQIETLPVEGISQLAISEELSQVGGVAQQEHIISQQGVLSERSSTSSSPIPAVLSSMMIPIGNIDVPPLLTPVQITKAVFLSLIMVLGGTLIYDAWIAENSKTVRLVGKNLGHIFFFGTVAYLIIFFKAGLVG